MNNNNALKNLKKTISNKGLYFKLAAIALIVTALVTLLVWLRYKSGGQLYLASLSFTWLNLLIWLAASILTVLLIHKLVVGQPFINKVLRKSASHDLPILVLFNFLSNILVAISMSLPAMALVGFFIVSNTYFRYSLLSSTQSWLGGYGWFAVITFIVLFVALFIGVTAIRLSGKIKLLNVVTSGVLLIVLCGLAYIPAYNQTKQLVNSASVIENAVVAGQSNTPQSLENINFSVYEPSYMTPGYTLEPASDSTYGPALYPANDSLSAAPEYFELVYFNGTQYGEIFIRSYATPTNYNPPSDCGTDYGGYDSGQCILIGHSSLDCNVYDINSGSGSQSENETFCQLGNTVVNSEFYTNLVSGASTTSTAQYNQITQIYNSLQKLTTQQVINLTQ